MGCYLHIVDGFALKIWFLSRRTAFCHQSWVRLTTITADQCKAIFQYTVSIMIILAVNYYYGHHRYLSIDVLFMDTRTTGFPLCMRTRRRQKHFDGAGWLFFVSLSSERLMYRKRNWKLGRKFSKSPTDILTLTCEQEEKGDFTLNPWNGRIYEALGLECVFWSCLWSCASNCLMYHKSSSLLHLRLCLHLQLWSPLRP